MPASTGTQGRKETSQRGVTPDHCGRVLVALASWRAPDSLKVRRISGSDVMNFPRGMENGYAAEGLGCEAGCAGDFCEFERRKPSTHLLYYLLG
ncbi:hypothetical protein DSM21852_23160 [Methylocystis bryophila]|nr:hypothetical protein DSM21852_23160 [Methylocystis bryophila]